MPELPEVENYRRKLEPIVVGKRVESAKVVKRNYAFLSSPQTIRRQLNGKSIRSIERHGKYLLFKIGKEEGTLLVHLGMTGQLFSRDYVPDKHVHLTLNLKGSRYPLYFRDPRKFGKLLWISAGREKHEPRLSKLGIDALKLTPSYLAEKIQARKCAIKTLLLDQGVVAGIGNIYADEALFRSGVRPTRAAQKLDENETKLLAKAVKDILKRAIKLGGSSINDYIHPDGSLGYFQIEHQVYGRAGEECRKCSEKIKRKVLGQRSSHYCPSCQK